MSRQGNAPQPVIRRPRPRLIVARYYLPAVLGPRNWYMGVRLFQPQPKRLPRLITSARVQLGKPLGSNQP